MMDKFFDELKDKCEKENIMFIGAFVKKGDYHFQSNTRETAKQIGLLELCKAELLKSWDKNE